MGFNDFLKSLFGNKSQRDLNKRDTPLCKQGQRGISGYRKAKRR